MYYSEPLDVESSEYAQVLKEEQLHKDNRLDDYLNDLYHFALNKSGFIDDCYLDAPRYKSIALRHGGTVAVYLESIRRGCSFYKLLGVEDHSIKWVDAEDIGPDCKFDNYQKFEADVMFSYECFMRHKSRCRQAALEAGIPDVPIHPDIQSVIDRALTNPMYADFHDILEGKKKFLTAEQMDYWCSKIHLLLKWSPCLDNDLKKTSPPKT